MNKELEALNKVTYGYGYDKNIEIISKSLKAFDIIKKKRVNVGNFIAMLEDWCSITYEDWIYYKEENGYYLQEELNEEEFGVITKEEFNLLKEVL